MGNAIHCHAVLVSYSLLAHDLITPVSCDAPWCWNCAGLPYRPSIGSFRTAGHESVWSRPTANREVVGSNPAGRATNSRLATMRPFSFALERRLSAIGQNRSSAVVSRPSPKLPFESMSCPVVRGEQAESAKRSRLPELLKQRLGVPQVLGLEAFGEPVVDGREQLARSVALSALRQ